MEHLIKTFDELLAKHRGFELRGLIDEAFMEAIRRKADRDSKFSRGGVGGRG